MTARAIDWKRSAYNVRDAVNNRLPRTDKPQRYNVEIDTHVSGVKRVFLVSTEGVKKEMETLYSWREVYAFLRGMRHTLASVLDIPA